MLQAINLILKETDTKTERTFKVTIIAQPHLLALNTLYCMNQRWSLHYVISKLALLVLASPTLTQYEILMLPSL